MFFIYLLYFEHKNSGRANLLGFGLSEHIIKQTRKGSQAVKTLYSEAKNGGHKQDNERY
jgi:hypothetical protein